MKMKVSSAQPLELDWDVSQKGGSRTGNDTNYDFLSFYQLTVRHFGPQILKKNAIERTELIL